LNPEVLTFLTLAETLVGWVDDHPELIAQAQAAYSRRNGDEPDSLTGIDELDDLDIADDEDDE
jgi:hypothetical protein